MKEQVIDLEKIFATHVSEESYLEYRKDPENSTVKKLTIQLANGQQRQEDISPKRTHGWQINTSNIQYH